MVNKLLTLVGVIFLFVFVIIGYRMYMVSRVSINGHYYEITIPGNRTQNTNFFTNTYVEKNGCITFKDEYNREHRICGSYNIEKY